MKKKPFCKGRRHWGGGHKGKRHRSRMFVRERKEFKAVNRSNEGIPFKTKRGLESSYSDGSVL